jgi:hypothetical protein
VIVAQTESRLALCFCMKGLSHLAKSITSLLSSLKAIADSPVIKVTRLWSPRVCLQTPHPASSAGFLSSHQSFSVGSWLDCALRVQHKLPVLGGVCPVPGQGHIFPSWSLRPCLCSACATDHGVSSTGMWTVCLFT